MLKGAEKKIKSWVKEINSIDNKIKKLKIKDEQLEEKCQKEIEKLASRFIKKAKHTDLLLNEPIHYCGNTFDHIEFNTEYGYTQAILFYVDENDEKQYCSCPASVVILPIIEKVKELYNE